MVKIFKEPAAPAIVMLILFPRYRQPHLLSRRVEDRGGIGYFSSWMVWPSFEDDDHQAHHCCSPARTCFNGFSAEQFGFLTRALNGFLSMDTFLGSADWKPFQHFFVDSCFCSVGWWSILLCSDNRKYLITSWRPFGLVLGPLSLLDIVCGLRLCDPRKDAVIG